MELSEDNMTNCVAPQPHPLFVDHILENVLNLVSNSSTHHLFNLRLVCSQWNHYATKILRKKHYISFGGHKYNVGRLKWFLDEFDQEEGRNEDYPQVFPVTRFRLFSDLFQEYNKPTVLKFMRKCGPIMESLVIFKDINSDIEYTPEELETFEFPCLKHLVFSDRRRFGFSHDANSQSFLLKLISSSKSTLTSLNIKFPREPIYEIQEKEDLIIKIFEKCTLPNLKILKLDMSITDKILKSLENCNLKLTKLHLSLGASQFSPESLKGFLHSLRFTMEDLRLTDLYRRASLAIDLPRLDNLKEFEIHGLELPAYFVTFPDFTYSSKMPNLRKLQINTWAPIKAWEVFVPETENDEQLELLKDSVSSVRELSLAMNFDCPILMKRTSSIFSGVKILQMHFSRAAVPALQCVFQHMPQLEELKLNQSYLGEISTNCIDDVLTGLEVEECKWILRKRAYKGSVMDKKPNLLDLKNLRKFDIGNLRHRNLITDVSGYLVFLKMDKLTTLDVGKSQLSDSCLRDLAIRFPQGKFKKYLSKKSKDETTLYKNSVITSLCAVQ